MKRIVAMTLIAIASIFGIGVLALGEEPAVLNLTEFKDAVAIDAHRDSIVTVTLKGKVSLAAFGDYHAIVPDVNVWVAEYPETKKMKIKSDKTGWWSMTVIKPKKTEPGFSFIYERKGWITTKSNVIPIGDEDNLDLSMQYIEPQLYKTLVKPGVEKMIVPMLPPGEDNTLRNALVVTVGKAWASMHDDRLPHGVAGATATVITGAVGPIYFDESVRPNPAYTKTSVDGGVAWVNVPPGEYVLTAVREDLKFNDVKFVISKEDAANKIILYIASPPDTIRSNDSTDP